MVLFWSRYYTEIKNGVILIKKVESLHGGTKIRPGIPSNWRIFESDCLDIESQFKITCTKTYRHAPRKQRSEIWTSRVSLFCA